MRFVSVHSVGVGMVAAAAIVMSACTTAMDATGIPHAGNQLDGSYVPTAEEKASDCTNLRNNVQLRIRAMKGHALSAVPLENQVPGTVAGVLSRMAGGASGGNQAIARYDAEYARAVALNSLLTSKKCDTVDLAAELKDEQQMIRAARR